MAFTALTLLFISFAPNQSQAQNTRKEEKKLERAQKKRQKQPKVRSISEKVSKEQRKNSAQTGRGESTSSGKISKPRKPRSISNKINKQNANNPRPERRGTVSSPSGLSGGKPPKVRSISERVAREQRSGQRPKTVGATSPQGLGIKNKPGKPRSISKRVSKQNVSGISPEKKGTVSDRSGFSYGRPPKARSISDRVRKQQNRNIAPRTKGFSSDTRLSSGSLKVKPRSESERVALRQRNTKAPATKGFSSNGLFGNKQQRVRPRSDSDKVSKRQTSPGGKKANIRTSETSFSGVGFGPKKPRSITKRVSKQNSRNITPEKKGKESNLSGLSGGGFKKPRTISERVARQQRSSTAKNASDRSISTSFSGGLLRWNPKKPRSISDRVARQQARNLTPEKKGKMSDRSGFMYSNRIKVRSRTSKEQTANRMGQKTNRPRTTSQAFISGGKIKVRSSSDAYTRQNEKQQFKKPSSISAPYVSRRRDSFYRNKSSVNSNFDLSKKDKELRFQLRPYSPETTFKNFIVVKKKSYRKGPDKSSSFSGTTKWGLTSSFKNHDNVGFKGASPSKTKKTRKAESSDYQGRINQKKLAWKYKNHENLGFTSNLKIKEKKPKQDKNVSYSGFLRVNQIIPKYSNLTNEGYLGARAARIKQIKRPNQSKSALYAGNLKPREMDKKTGVLYQGNIKTNQRKKPQSIDYKMQYVVKKTGKAEGTEFQGNIKTKGEKREAAQLKKTSLMATQYKGGNKVKIKKLKDKHPSADTRFEKLATSKYQVNLMRRSSIKLNKLFFNRQQPNNLKAKVKKPGYDKGERELWAY